MKKYLALFAFLPLITWLVGMILFTTLAYFGMDCPLTGDLPLICTIPMTLTWYGFGFLYTIYTLPIALAILVLHVAYKKFTNSSIDSPQRDTSPE